MMKYICHGVLMYSRTWSFNSLRVLFFIMCLINSIQLNFCSRIKKDGLSPVTSIENKFTINQNTIILTAESRSMGAHYINETDFITNEECLIWCWENANCNVAVFEGMTRRSCFLFDCGSPADFCCKFTHHNFYTSSIMKATQHSYDLKQWGKDEKQKNEVASIQQPSTIAPSSAPIVQTAPASAVLNIPVSTTSSQIQPVPKIKEQKCRHYQFQCLNSSDCIAIYNVCDGIPQCPDGSDESTYLQCPNKGEIVKSSPPTSDVVPTSPNSGKHVEAPVMVANTVVTQLPQSHVVLKPQPPHFKPPHHENTNLQPSTSNDHKGPIHPEMNQKPPLQEGYGTGQAMDYDHAVDGSGAQHTLFSHKHSKFVAANNAPHIQYPNKWSDEYERYSQQPINIEQQYNPYESGYPRINDGYPKNQYPDYDRTAYDTYHQEENPFWMEQERLKGSGYISNDYSPSNNPSPNRQIPYPSREELYAVHQIPVKSEGVGRYPQPQMDKPVVNRPHAIQELHRPKIAGPDNYPAQRPKISDSGNYPAQRPKISDSDNYPIQRPKIAEPDNYPDQRPNQQRLLPYGSYEEMPRTDYRMYPDFNSQGIEGSRQRISPNVFDSEEAIRESLAKQLQSQAAEPAHMYEPIIEIPVPTTPSLATSNSIQKSMISGNPSSGNLESTTSQAIPPKLNPTKIAQLKPKHEALVLGKMTEAELAQSRHTHRQERNNAILALILGLVVTGMLVVLVGCRMKTLRRRSARRGRTLAHDADYLVNGLYL